MIFAMRADVDTPAFASAMPRCRHVYVAADDAYDFAQMPPFAAAAPLRAF